MDNFHNMRWSSWAVIFQCHESFRFWLKLQATATHFKGRYWGKKLKVLIDLVLDRVTKAVEVLGFYTINHDMWREKSFSTWSPIKNYQTPRWTQELQQKLLPLFQRACIGVYFNYWFVVTNCVFNKIWLRITLTIPGLQL